MREGKAVLVVLGSRGVPGRYGGFETLASILDKALASSALEVQVRASTLLTRSSRFNRAFETVLGTLLSVRGIPPATTVLIFNPVNVITAMWLKARGHSVVLHLDGRDDLRLKWPWIVRKCYRLVQELAVRSTLGLVIDSAIVKKEILGDRPRRHCEIIKYGGCTVCKGKLRHQVRLSNHHRFLSLARAEPENQLHRVIRAFNKSSVSGQLTVVTVSKFPSRYWRSLEQMFVPGGSTELVKGIWDETELCNLYRRATAVVHGHTVGGTNPSLVLALCHGTPVFAHDNPYNREVAGSLARYWKDENDLTQLLDEFDPAAWPYDQEAVDDFNRRYNWDDVVEEYRKVLGLDQSSGS